MRPLHRRPLHRTLSMLAATALAATLAACGGGGSDSSGSGAAEPSATAPRTITDSAGRQVTVPAKVERVVTVGSVPVLNSFPFAVGAGSTIVNGIPGGNTSSYSSYKVLAPGLLTAPTVQSAIGQPVNVEAVLELKPDVAFTSTPATAEQLQAAGVPTVVLNLETGDKIKDSVRVTGEVYGHQQQAADYLTYFDDTVKRVNEIKASIPDAEQPSVLYIDLKPLRRPNRIMEWMLDQVGAKSVTRDVQVGQFQFGVEQLQKWDPQMLIGMAAYDLPGLTGDPKFAALQAVKNKKIGIIPTGIQIWGNNTTEQPLGVLWVARFLHPDAYAEIDMAAETKNFYAKFYGITLTDAQVTQILNAGV